MKLTRSWLFAVISLVLPQLAWSNNFEASFDCAKAKSGSEQLICGDKNLSWQDNTMASRYSALISRLSEERKETLRRTQRDWLKKREDCASQERNKECLALLYGNRVMEFDSLLAEKV